MGAGKIDRVLVVGCGPAGLAAAHAATGLGYPVRVIAPKRKTPQRGPLLLQRPIPGITTSHPDGYIRQIVIGGSILDYRGKLYGDINISINGDILQDGYHAWHFAEAYDALWDLYSDLIDDVKVTPEGMMMESLKAGQLVVCTAPAPDMCMYPDIHEFQSVTIGILPRALCPRQPDDTIIFNGNPASPWARSSRIFGNEVTELVSSAAPWGNFNSDRDDYRLIRKPISHNCKCHPRVLRTGRFGAWRNETWVDTAYYAVREALISDHRQVEWKSIEDVTR